MFKLDIIIPVYNEDEKIVDLINQLKEGINHKFRILICFDEDNDKTLQYLKNNKLVNDEVVLVKNTSNGPNSAIIEGIKNSSSEII